MSSLEEFCYYEGKLGNLFKFLSYNVGDVDDNCLVILRDIYGLYGVYVSNFLEDILEKVLNRMFFVVGKVVVCKIMELRYCCVS